MSLRIIVSNGECCIQFISFSSHVEKTTTTTEPTVTKQWVFLLKKIERPSEFLIFIFYNLSEGKKLTFSQMEFTKSNPNILITGTPGTGKTTLADSLASRTGFSHIDVGKLVKDKDLHDGRDEEFDCFILNEDKVLKFSHVVDFIQYLSDL
jgi:hypothetical protein